MRRKYIQSNTKPFAYCPEGRKIGTSLDRDHYVAVAGMPEQLLHEGSKEIIGLGGGGTTRQGWISIRVTG
jgi:hypothetical protein